MKALNARSLSGSVFNLAVGLTLALSAAVLAFNAVPAARLGAARPEAAWAFFWVRATALVVISEGEISFFFLRNGVHKTRQALVHAALSRLDRSALLGFLCLYQPGRAKLVTFCLRCRTSLVSDNVLRQGEAAR